MSGRCRCGISDVAPWRGHDLPFSLASVVAGLITLLVAVVAVVAARVRWAGPALIAIWIVATLAMVVLARRKGHRGWCLVRRSLWMGVAVLGLPLRVVASLPF